MTKSKVTRTYGPIHFEDLEPHRFEDLVRELIYDYKDWQSIEATGRSGSDEGFDIRAYEKIGIVSQSENKNNEVIEEIHPMEGNLWMIQGKREKAIGPKKLKEYLEEVNEKSPPYGYIFAASVNFSKKAYDIFREELKRKGIMEFYLWGKAELEDMLHLPKNDRILFTFFGISLVSKRRSRTTEIRSVVNTKNRLYQVIGDSHQLHSNVLIRDLKDIHYPNKCKYKDFKERPRWKEYIVFSHYPTGLLCHLHKYLTYIDIEKKEWDFTKEVNLIFLQGEEDTEREIQQEKQKIVNDVYDFFPKDKQGYFIRDALVKYSDIMLVDKVGDEKYKFPHLYVDFTGDGGSFSGYSEFLKLGERKIEITDEYKRIDVFPKKFKKQKIGKIHKKKKISLNSESIKQFNKYEMDTLYDLGGKYDFLNPRDIISIDNPEEESNDQLIQITHKFKSKIGDYLEGRNFQVRGNIGIQLEKEPNEKEEINIYEFKRIYEWQFKKKGKSKK